MITPSSDAEPSVAGAGAARVADLQLRGPAGPLPARVHWPARSAGDPAPALLVLFPAGGSADGACRALSARTGAVVLAASLHRESPPRPTAPTATTATVEDAITVTQWAADHAAELDADPGRLLVGGEGAGAALAAAVVAHARDEGWPPITQVRIDPDTDIDTDRSADADPGPALHAGRDRR